MAKNLGFSVSRWGCAKKCLRQFKYKYIDKLPEVDTYAASRGSRIHAMAEQFVKGNIVGMPKELKDFDKDFKYLKELFEYKLVKVEPRICVRSDWSIMDNEGDNGRTRHDWTNYFSCGFLDAAVDLEPKRLIIDYKSGKIREDEHEEGASLYACMSILPHEKSIAVEYWYLDHGEILSWTYTQADVKKLRKMWMRRYKKLAAETEYLCTPSYLCNYCTWSRSEGGPCEEG